MDRFLIKYRVRGGEWQRGHIIHDIGVSSAEQQALRMLRTQYSVTNNELDVEVKIMDRKSNWMSPVHGK